MFNYTDYTGLLHKMHDFRVLMVVFWLVGLGLVVFLNFRCVVEFILCILKFNNEPVYSAHKLGLHILHRLHVLSSLAYVCARVCGVQKGTNARSTTHFSRLFALEFPTLSLYSFVTKFLLLSIHPSPQISSLNRPLYLLCCRPP